MNRRVNFAKEWAEKNNVEMQITLVPWKEFDQDLRRYSGQSHPRHRRNRWHGLQRLGQLLEATDVYKLDKEQKAAGWALARSIAEAGKVHHLLSRVTGFMIIARNDLLKQAGAKLPMETWEDLLAAASKPSNSRASVGWGIRQ
jgi:ABC-type glycerol-3-phosphate transport system substrate-binding protein